MLYYNNDSYRKEIGKNKCGLLKIKWQHIEQQQQTIIIIILCNNNKMTTDAWYIKVEKKYEMKINWNQFLKKKHEWNAAGSILN